jgi:histidine triad (HIT) family protein
MDCIFCQIAAGQVPSDTLYQDERVMAFRDIRPITPTHVVIIPKKHIPSLLQLSEADLPLMADLVKVANQLAKREGIAEKGYRLVINCGREGTQFVSHLHMHLLGGRQLSAALG